MELSNFPLASDADCQWLKQELSGLPCHCPYIFDNCRLPDGCQPDQAGVFLRREVGRYSMELDRSVQYRGRNRAMKVLASRILAAERERQSSELSADRKAQVGSGDRC